jgi:hypothetical protein
MNIFVLDEDPRKAAQFHCDKHVVKMILEAGQMMCSSHWLWNLRTHRKKLSDFKRVRDAKEFVIKNTEPKYIPPWNMSHVRHPCTLWTAENTGNYIWHTKLMRGLLDEYTLRYQKKHKSEEVYDWLLENIPRNMRSGMKTDHPLCMPEECKIEGDPVSSYRKYYISKKSHMARWKTGDIPPWWLD